MLKIAEPITTLARFDVNLAALQRFAVWASKDREQDAVQRTAARPIPGDIEEVSVARIRPILQNIKPPGVVAARGHMVWNDIEDES